MADLSTVFFCKRREMPVATDTTDCKGCGMREYPSPCPQFAEYHRKMKQGELGYTPEIYRDAPPPIFDGPMRRPDITE